MRRSVHAQKQGRCSSGSQLGLADLMTGKEPREARIKASKLRSSEEPSLQTASLPARAKHWMAQSKFRETTVSTAGNAECEDGQVGMGEILILWLERSCSPKLGGGTDAGVRPVRWQLLCYPTYPKAFWCFCGRRICWCFACPPPLPCGQPPTAKMWRNLGFGMLVSCSGFRGEPSIRTGLTCVGVASVAACMMTLSLRSYMSCLCIQICSLF